MDSFLDIESSLGGRYWRSRSVDEARASQIVNQAGLSFLAARLLAGRGIEPEQANAYLSPSIRATLPDPSCFADMDAAATILLEAIYTGRPTAVLADYDVDGACSAALLIRYFRHWGADLRLYVPDRLNEGYGPSPLAFSRLKEAGCELVIAVDCGASAHQALETADELGLEIIVLDHHQIHGELPKIAAMVNPARSDCGSGCGYLAATGLVFIALVALNRLARRRQIEPPEGLPDLLEWLDLCALGTICDMVPLRDLNRAFVVKGLQILSKDRSLNAGLAALRQVAGIGTVDSVYHLGFELGPMLNAGGRIGDSMLAARLLSTEDRGEAIGIAERLHAANAARKALEASMIEQAMQQARLLLDRAPDTGVLVLSASGWHPGIIGIVAGRVKDRFHRPVIIIGGGEEYGEIWRGSGRSVSGFSIGSAIAEAYRRGLVIAGGGHAMAAGLSCRHDQIAELSSFMSGQRLDRDILSGARTLSIDGLVAAGSADLALLEEISQIGPFGSGSPEPVLVLPGVRPEYIRLVGSSHLAFRATGEDGEHIGCIAFRSADTALGEALRRGERLHLAGHLRPDSWRGKNAVQLQVIDAAKA